MGETGHCGWFIVHPPLHQPQPRLSQLHEPSAGTNTATCTRCSLPTNRPYPTRPTPSRFLCPQEDAPGQAQAVPCPTAIPRPALTPGMTTSPWEWQVEARPWRRNAPRDRALPLSSRRPPGGLLSGPACLMINRGQATRYAGVSQVPLDQRQ